jgi:uncharacterized protein
VKPDLPDKIAALDHTLKNMGRVSVAVSGGVDSVTLAFAAHRRLGGGATMYHAVSPAVPAEATERTQHLALQFGWNLQVIDAGEFSDPDYIRNPVNRCFYCKSNLYGTIARRTSRTIVSGTNMDDLADYRPGLDAAADHGVRHPYVEANIDKRMVREIARACGLNVVAELPASPCLSSRIETGIRVDAESLSLVHAIEKLVGRRLRPNIVRCRVRQESLEIELDEATYRHVCATEKEVLSREIENFVMKTGGARRIEFRPYKMGSAFLRHA